MLHIPLQLVDPLNSMPFLLLQCHYPDHSKAVRTIPSHGRTLCMRAGNSQPPHPSSRIFLSHRPPLVATAILEYY